MCAAEAYALAFSASVHSWALISQTHGISPTIEDLRCTATSLMMATEKGLGAQKVSQLPTGTVPKVPEIPGSQLVTTRATQDVAIANYATQSN